jgi:serine phosphatase RsbU (regulator of sigma subunit)
MLPRLLRPPLWLVFAILFTLATPLRAHQPAPLIVDNLGQGSVALDGPWQFHLGDDMRWAAPEAADTTGQNGWEQITTDQPWGAQGHRGVAGFAWYRRHISISSNPSNLAILFPNVEDSAEVYWNGKLIGRQGSVPPHPVWYMSGTMRARIFELGPISPNSSGVLAVRVWKAPFGSQENGVESGFHESPILGTPQAIEQALAAQNYEWLIGNQLDFVLNSLYALVVLLGFLAWMRDRSQWLIFWMAVFAASKLLIWVTFTLPLEIPATATIWLFMVPFGLADISLWYLLIWLLDLRDRPGLLKTTKIVAIIGVLVTNFDGLVNVFFGAPNPVPFQILDSACVAIWIVEELFVFYLIGVALFRRQHLHPTRWIVATLAFLTQMIYAVSYESTQGSRFTHWTIGDRINASLFTISGNSVNIQTICGTLLLIAIVYAVYQFSADTRRRQIALEQEFQNARELQQVLIPEDLPAIPGYTLTTAYKPALEVGGDFFQIIPLSDKSTLIVLGDVSGKGLKAAMAVSLIVGMIRALAPLFPDPGKLLSEINDRLVGRLQDGFATAIALRLQPSVDSDTRCTIASAGHTPPFLNDLEVALPGAFPLGLACNVRYEETALNLPESAHLAIYTDGLLEARDPSGELYGFDRLKTLFATNPTAEQAAEAAVAFGQDDDITVLTVTALQRGLPA